VRQRYWKQPKGRFKKVPTSGRYEFHGTGRQLQKAIIKAIHRVPKPPKHFIDVSAEEFLEHPEKYSVEGEWIEWEVES